MDFSTFDTKEAADDGAVLHFTHPILGHALYDGPGADAQGRLMDPAKDHQPVTAMVRGYHAPIVQAATKSKARARMQGQTHAEVEAVGRKLIDALIVSWQGITRDGKPLSCTAENKVWLTETNHAIFSQIDEFAKDQANFFADAATS